MTCFPRADAKNEAEGEPCRRAIRFEHWQNGQRRLKPKWISRVRI